MLRVASLMIAAIGVCAALAGPVLAESATIRIEPRPYHGAIVTIEQGVRVWRPLPPQRYVIINPNGQTPLSLGLTDVREQSTSHNYFYGSGNNTNVSGGAVPNTYGVPLVGGHARRGDRRHHHRGRVPGIPR